MGRKRLIDPRFFDDEDLGEMPVETRLFFIALWTESDKEGRLQDRPRVLKNKLMMFDDVDADRMLCQLAEGGFICRYSVHGKRYIQINPAAWIKYQHPHSRESDSIIPEPCTPKADNVAEPFLPKADIVAERCNQTTDTDTDTDTDTESNTDTDADAASATAPSTTEEGARLFVTKDGEWMLNTERHLELIERYPSIDVKQELRRIQFWCDDNPQKRKTKRGMWNFLNNWMKRAEKDAPRSEVVQKPAEKTAGIGRPGNYDEIMDFMGREYSGTR